MSLIKSEIGIDQRRAIMFIVPCVAVPQPRQRTRTMRAKDGRTFTQNYTPADSPINAFKATVRMAAREAYSGPPIAGPVRVKLTFVFPRPMAMRWKRRPMPRTPHAKKPDADNLIKGILDCLNQVIWYDDSQVYECCCEKVIAAGDEPPHTEVTIHAAEGHKRAVAGAVPEASECP